MGGRKDKWPKKFPIIPRDFLPRQTKDEKELTDQVHLENMSVKWKQK